MMMNNNMFHHSSTFWFLLLLLMAPPLPPVNAFEAIPFLQIDANFYLQLAQCQAKCADKFSLDQPALDSIISAANNAADSAYLDNNSGVLLQLCQQGCLDSDSPSSISTNAEKQHSPESMAFVQGQHFFFQSTQQQNHNNNNKHHRPHQHRHQSANVNVRPGQLRPLCAQRMVGATTSTTNNIVGGGIDNQQQQQLPSLHDKFEALMAIDQSEEEEKPLAGSSTTRFVVKWRRKAVFGNNNNGEKSIVPAVVDEAKEPQWITASIEPTRVFRVTSLRAGLLHQFQVQPVTGHGPQGVPITSDWFDFALMAEYGSGLPATAGNYQQQNMDNIGQQQQSVVNFFSQYNSEHGVAAWMRWNNDGQQQMEKNDGITIPGGQKPPVLGILRSRRTAAAATTNAQGHVVSQPEGLLSLSADQGVPVPMMMPTIPTTTKSSFVVFPSCRLQIEWANKSTRTVEEFDLGGSDGFLLKHLAFNTEYSVRVTAAAGGGNMQKKQTATLLEGTFLSMHCTQVFGAGSLECEPEQVRGLAVALFPENQTALVSWKQPDGLSNILLYELAIEPVHDASGGQCRLTPSARIVSAQAISALVSLPDITTVCSYEARLTVYDLLGRDASSLVRFTYVPTSLPASPAGPFAWQAVVHLDGSLVALLCVAVFVPIAALVTLVCTITRHGRKASSKTARKATGREGGDSERRMKKKQETENKKTKKKNKKQGEEEENKENQQQKDKLIINSSSNNNGTPCHQTLSSAASSAVGGGQQPTTVSSLCNSPQSSSGGTEVTTTTTTNRTTTTLALLKGDGGGGGEWRQQLQQQNPKNATPIGIGIGQQQQGGGVDIYNDGIAAGCCATTTHYDSLSCYRFSSPSPPPPPHSIFASRTTTASPPAASTLAMASVLTDVSPALSQLTQLV